MPRVDHNSRVLLHHFEQSIFGQLPDMLLDDHDAFPVLAMLVGWDSWELSRMMFLQVPGICQDLDLQVPGLAGT